MSSSISFDINIAKWESDIRKVREKTIYKFNRSMYAASQELLQKIKEYTPIGNPDLWHPPYWPKNYVPGTLRASWEMHIEGAIITISNPQPYAYRVEYGAWSSQAPEGMMRRALYEYPAILRRAFSDTGL